jgi:hypothetical protein
MIDVDMRADQILGVMQHNVGFCDVPHGLGRLTVGDVVTSAGYVFVVRGVVAHSRFDRLWLKRR